ncbi:glucan biosynthesis protein [Algiphilus sp.]|uniref:glucan biosynthesis protein n=1 Tax=Algiphilus sp. TaxID=1872431 RepID=UPI003BA8A48B
MTVRRLPRKPDCRSRTGWQLVAGGLLALATATTAAKTDIRSLEALAKHAKALAAEAYRAPETSMPPALRDLDYDAYRDIRFRPKHAIWRDTDLPVEIQLLHLGMFYKTPVEMHLITQDGVRPIAFNPALFDYGRNSVPTEIPDRFGFSGFRMHYPLNTPDYKDELVVFQGASYFRALGAGQQFGLSARGLAIDTAEPEGEEFPVFRAFWVKWPRADATRFEVLALLDSRSVTGAYRIEITPGETTRTRVTAELFPRQPIGKLGIAPLTSMYQYGETRPRPDTDFRPEVHDSDGLLVHSGEEWLWRPLSNPGQLTSNAFSSRRLHGFGLMQRDRAHDSYADLEAHYERRPSAWVETHGDWGEGHVELVQIPTKNEMNDNIVAYWVPDEAIQPGASYRVSYTVHWQNAQLTGPDLGRVTATRIARPAEDNDATRFVVDFEGETLADLPPEAVVRAEVGQSGGFQTREVQTMRNRATGGWRAVLTGRPEDGAASPIDLRLALVGKDDQPLTEVWSYTVHRP